MTCSKCGAAVTEAVRATDGATITLDSPALGGSLQASGCCDDHPLVVREQPDLVGIVPLYTEHRCR